MEIFVLENRDFFSEILNFVREVFDQFFVTFANLDSYVTSTRVFYKELKNLLRRVKLHFSRLVSHEVVHSTVKAI